MRLILVMHILRRSHDFKGLCHALRFRFVRLSPDWSASWWRTFVLGQNVALGGASVLFARNITERDTILNKSLLRRSTEKLARLQLPNLANALMRKWPSVFSMPSKPKPNRSLSSTPTAFLEPAPSKSTPQMFFFLSGNVTVRYFPQISHSHSTAHWDGKKSQESYNVTDVDDKVELTANRKTPELRTK